MTTILLYFNVAFRKKITKVLAKQDVKGMESVRMEESYYA